MQKRKIAMLTALYANTNFDGSENSDKREQILARMEEEFQKAVGDLYKSKAQKARDAEAENLRNDPFFQPMYKSLEEKGILDSEESEYEVDQQ